jgi:hypothetical protein
MGLFTATIDVSRAGYEWVRPGRPGRILQPIEERRAELAEEFAEATPEERDRFCLLGLGGSQQYDPFADQPALFYRFAFLKPTPEAIRDFAGQFGVLDTSNPATLDKWRSTIKHFQYLVGLWESRNEGNDYGRQVSDRIVREGVDGQQMAVELRTIALGQAVPFAMRFSLSQLRDVLWTQFVVAIEQGQEFRKCGWCEKPFLLSPQRPGKGRRGRSDRQFCSDSCRVQAYMRRKNTAIKLRAGGMKLRDILKEVETDMDTLKLWLGEDK